jgi:hypothetical protein
MNTNITSPSSNTNPIITKQKITFESVREQNWSKIDNFYNKIVNDYNTKKQQYDRGIISSNNDDIAYARFLLPQVNDYRSQMMEIYSKMMELIEQNDNIIMEQKLNTDKLELENSKLIANIKQIKLKQKSANSEATSHIDNRNSIEDELEYYNKWVIGYKISLVFLGIISILLIIYKILYSSNENYNNQTSYMITNNKFTNNTITSTTK